MPDDFSCQCLAWQCLTKEGIRKIILGCGLCTVALHSLAGSGLHMAGSHWVACSQLTHGLSRLQSFAVSCRQSDSAADRAPDKIAIVILILLAHLHIKSPVLR